jgi:hypothetical protein
MQSTYWTNSKFLSKISWHINSNLSIIPNLIKLFLADYIISDEISIPNIFDAPKFASFYPMGHGPHPTSKKVFP